MPKRTWNPKKKKRQRAHGFLNRAKNAPKILKRRRQKGRKKLSV